MVLLGELSSAPSCWVLLFFWFSVDVKDESWEHSEMVLFEAIEVAFWSTSNICFWEILFVGSKSELVDCIWARANCPVNWAHRSCCCCNCCCIASTVSRSACIIYTKNKSGFWILNTCYAYFNTIFKDDNFFQSS